MMNKIKIGYFADGPWAHIAFERLISKNFIDFSFIVPRFDSRDKKLRQLSKKFNIPYIKSKNINSIDFLKKIQGLETNLFISMSFNQIFRTRIINFPKHKTINCHAGKLPFYRGRNVINWAIINGEKDFGITVHYVDEGIDTGDIILQNTYKILSSDNYNTVLNKAYKYCAEALEESIKMIINNSFTPIKQSLIHPTGFYCAQRIKGSELIDWNQNSKSIWNFIRGICAPSGPGARSFCRNKEFIINEVKLTSNAPNYIGIPGQVIGKDKNIIRVKTLDSWVDIISYNGPFIPKVSECFQNKKIF